PAAVLGGVGTLVVAGLWMRLFPDLLNREFLHPQAAGSMAGPLQPP
ncbi:MAG TPA: MFS transporter, partial [Verrucomicrobiae bacterium]|nr:MFS transporter [Verrucomicrobiae bacterium]